MFRFSLALLAGIFLVPQVASAAEVYNESVNGDLSGTRSAPTVITVASGSNTLTATSVSGDVEYFTFNVPSGFRLSAINLVAATATSFIAIQNGSTFTEPPTGTNVANLLGYAHMTTGLVGTDMLDDMGLGAGSQTFTPPLPAGNYAFWSQETGSTPRTYTLDFQITAEPPRTPLPPAFAGLFALGLSAVGAWQLRRRRRLTAP